MVHINPGAVPTTSHYAAPAISTPHLPTQSGRDRLRRSLGTALGLACPLIATTETLSVALAHFDHLGPNLAADAVTELLSAPTAFADAHLLAEQPLHILVERPKPKLNMRACTERRAQQATLFPVETRASSRESSKPLVRELPRRSHPFNRRRLSSRERFELDGTRLVDRCPTARCIRAPTSF